MNGVRQVIVVVGVAVLLFEAAFPPLRSPQQFYTEPQLVNGEFVANHISRFSVWRPGLAKLEHSEVVRIEVDPGELTREVIFLTVLLGLAYSCAPKVFDPSRHVSTQK
jgi:hypothetical protein